MDKSVYAAYVQILKEELVPAMGCTEPISLAYAAATVRETLGTLPERADVWVSPNIIKNVKSVVVPHTGGLKGIAAAVAAGFVAGDATQELEVLSGIQECQIAEIKAFLKNKSVVINVSDNGYIFDIQICAQAGDHKAFIQIAGTHTNIIRLTKDGDVLISQDYIENGADRQTERALLTVAQIVEFADVLNAQDVKETLDRQIEYNMAIAREGIHGNWGASIGRTLMRAYGDSVFVRAKAMAAAGSDGRMSGCELPVVINSGSGNQGITASVPVIVYAEELKVSREKLYRALAVANLVTIHLKTGIGTLSAYCGATSAGCGAAAGITYLYGGKAHDVSHTIVNAIAINSGMICDGAKASCAAKIASAVEAGLLGMQMQFQGSQFYGGDGIVIKGVENTINNIGKLARDGMAETDKEIINLMIS